MWCQGGPVAARLPRFTPLGKEGSGCPRGLRCRILPPPNRSWRGPMLECHLVRRRSDRVRAPGGTTMDPAVPTPTPRGSRLGVPRTQAHWERSERAWAGGRRWSRDVCDWCCGVSSPDLSSVPACFPDGTTVNRHPLPGRLTVGEVDGQSTGRSAPRPRWRPESSV